VIKSSRIRKHSVFTFKAPFFRILNFFHFRTINIFRIRKANRCSNSNTVLLPSIISKFLHYSSFTHVFLRQHTHTHTHTLSLSLTTTVSPFIFARYRAPPFNIAHCRLRTATRFSFYLLYWEFIHAWMFTIRCRLLALSATSFLQNSHPRPRVLYPTHAPHTS
jgi:hypothetical protein